MTFFLATRRVISVLVTLVKPRVVVALEARRIGCASLHAVFQRLELAEDLSSTGYVESLVNRDYFHCVSGDGRTPGSACAHTVTVNDSMLIIIMNANFVHAMWKQHIRILQNRNGKPLRGLYHVKGSLHARVMHAN